eukprot:comp15659_c0_seq1/m.24126 comp15659_c0_seq1/g.24126  ORF comp15659_c0_seq1/g.24126 comp15659_c0_seq1/m.24126 type:complete len:316 (-) comp15659_c0_seq1:61-1008(-)
MPLMIDSPLGVGVPGGAFSKLGREPLYNSSGPSESLSSLMVTYPEPAQRSYYAIFDAKTERFPRQKPATQAIYRVPELPPSSTPIRSPFLSPGREQTAVQHERAPPPGAYRVPDPEPVTRGGADFARSHSERRSVFADVHSETVNLPLNGYPENTSLVQVINHSPRAYANMTLRSKVRRIEPLEVPSYTLDHLSDPPPSEFDPQPVKYQRDGETPKIYHSTAERFPKVVEVEKLPVIKPEKPMPQSKKLSNIATLLHRPRKRMEKFSTFKLRKLETSEFDYDSILPPKGITFDGDLTAILLADKRKSTDKNLFNW